MQGKVTVPTSLSEITLNQYQRFLKVQEINNDEHILQCKMIEIFCNVDFKDVKKIKLKDAQKIIEMITRLFETKPQLVKTFKLNGVEFAFHPDLESMTMGEYIDVDTYLPQNNQMHLALNVLYRPIKNKSAGKYSIEEYNIDTKDRMLDMPLDAVLGAVFFFQNLGLELLAVMNHYLVGELDKQQLPLQDLDKNGVGIQASMHSLKEILEDLKISLN